MNKREAAIVSAYTGYLIGDIKDMHRYIEEILGRQVFVHELANDDIVDEIREKSRYDFINIEIEEE